MSFRRLLSDIGEFLSYPPHYMRILDYPPLPPIPRPSQQRIRAYAQSQFNARAAAARSAKPRKRK